MFLRNMWNRRRIISELGNDQSAFVWCQNNGLLPREKMCPRHRTPMLLDLNRPGLGQFRCNVQSHNLRLSVAKGNWFEEARLPLNKIFRYNFCREVVIDDFLIRQENRGQIGGVGTIVQIDESKFGKRKFNRERRTEGHWILGMIEDGSEDFRLVVCPDNVRDAATLIIEEHVASETEIRTDMWKAYTRLPEHGYIHKVVNHSDPENQFVSPEGVHTQRIESSWRPAKDWFRSKHVPKEKFVELVVEYQWRRGCKKSGLDPFDSLLFAIRLGFPI